MKVLFVLPYPASRIRTRSYNFVHALAGRGHEVSVASLYVSEEERRQLNRLGDSGVAVFGYRLSTARSLANCLRALRSAIPLQAVYCWHPGFLRRLKLLVASKKPDVIHLEHLRASLYGLGLSPAPASKRKTPPPPVVFDSVDCLSSLCSEASICGHSRLIRFIAKQELPRTRLFEATVPFRFAAVLVSSQKDRSLLTQLEGECESSQRSRLYSLLGDYVGDLATESSEKSAAVEVVHHGVDINYFCRNGEEAPNGSLVFSGKMSYHANVAAAEHLIKDIMPLVWKRKSWVKLDIVGQDPPKSLRFLAARQRGRVEVTGSVPDIRPFLRRSAVAVVPILYGAGIQNKVLEAMACGTPVVAYDRAVAGLGIETNRDLLAATDTRTFVDGVLALLDHTDRRQSLSRSGRRFVARVFSLEAAGRHLEEVYANSWSGVKQVSLDSPSAG